MTVGTIEDSRLKGGTLMLDAVPFAKQATECALTPSVAEEGERTEVLSGAVIEPEEVTSWTLDLNAIQDFDDPAGFVEFARSNAGQIVSFSWEPNETGAPTYAGTVRVRAVKIGGTVAARNNSDTSWPVIGDFSTTYPGP